MNRCCSPCRRSEAVVKLLKLDRGGDLAPDPAYQSFRPLRLGFVEMLKFE